MQRARVLLAGALAFAAPAAGQTGGGTLPTVAAWVERFAAINAGPGVAAQACAPLLNRAMASMADQASARAAMASVKPCHDRVRAAYAAVLPQLDRLQPLPASVEADLGFSSSRFIADQRRLIAQTVAYFDDLDRFMAAMVAGDRAGAAQLHTRVRQQGGALIDGNILLLRVQLSATTRQVPRRVGELRIVLLEAAKALATASPTPRGLELGASLQTLAARARAATAAVAPAWQADRAYLRGLSATRTAQLEAPTARFVADVERQGGALAATLTGAGVGALPPTTATRLANDLNAIGSGLLRSAQSYAAGLQGLR